MALSIPKPDVTIEIVTRVQTPTVATPTLPACIVGPCYQVLDPQLSAGLAPNPDAKIELPAIIRSLGQAAATGATASVVTVTLNVNGVAAVATFPIAAGGYSVAAILAAINASLVAAGAPALATTVGTAGSAKARFILKATSKGGGNCINWVVTDAAAGADALALSVTALKIPVTWRAEGISDYQNVRLAFMDTDYPDPLGIGTELDIDGTTVRVFGALSAGLSEWHRNSKVTRCGSAASISYPDDGDSDGYTPLVLFAGNATPSDVLPSAIVAGLINFTATPATQISWTAPGAVAATPHASGTIFVSVCGSQEQGIDIDVNDTATLVFGKINARFPSIASGAATLVINLANLAAGFAEVQGCFGRDSVFTIRGSSAQLMADLFNNGVLSALDAGIVQRGTWHAVAAPAELWVDGVFLGRVIEVNAAQLKLDREIPQEVGALRSFFIKKLGLVAAMDGSVTVVAPDLVVADSLFAEAPEGTTRIGPEILRDGITGAPYIRPLVTSGAACDTYMGYTGLRLDVSPSASEPGLVAFASAVDLASEMAPIDTTNPLALGLYYAMLNAPGMVVYGLGVDEVSATHPEGTLASYDECLEFLEAKAVYSLVPLSADIDVAKHFHTHVALMSQPDYKSERIMWFCPEFPTRGRPLTIASGSKGNCNIIVSPSGVFHTSIPDIGARFAAAGIPIPPVPGTDRVYLQTAAYGTKMFAVTAVSGPDITIADYVVGTLPFEATIALAALIDEPFTIAQLGASLYTGTVYDKAKGATAIAGLGQEFSDRRVRMVIPDEVLATINGLESVIPGYYAACALAGMKSFQSPAIGFTNQIIGGLIGVRKTFGFFRGQQLDEMAGGGSWILIPGPGTSSVMTRMALTTDTSTIEYRQDTWTSALDYGCMLLRDMLRRIIGPTNITQESKDLVAALATSGIKNLTDNNIWAGGSLESVEQSSTNPDTMEVGISAQMFYSLHYIRVTITV